MGKLGQLAGAQDRARQDHAARERAESCGRRAKPVLAASVLRAEHIPNSYGIQTNTNFFPCRSCSNQWPFEGSNAGGQGWVQFTTLAWRWGWSVSAPNLFGLSGYGDGGAELADTSWR
jgi:hypothetical protein